MEQGLKFVCILKQPCGLAVEFGNAVYVTDAMAASILVITTMKKNADFRQSIGVIYNTRCFR